MAKTAKPVFAQKTQLTPVVFGTASTPADGSGTLSAACVTGGTDDTRITRFHFTARGTTSAGFLRVWLVDGSTIVCLGQVDVTAVAALTATVKPWEGDLALPEPLVLKSGQTIKCSTYIGENFSVIPYSQDY